MDINDYLSKIRQDIDRQVNEIRSQTDSVLKDIAGQVPGYIPTRDMQEKRLLRLVTEDRLEETSKAKIGTFEKLYSDIYRSETGRPLSYGYEDLDYSSLIGLLVSVLEIEINLSVYQELRRLFGVRMPDFANRAAESRIVLLGGNYSVDVGKKEQTLGPIRALAEFKQSDLGHIIPEFGEFVRFLGSFIGIRNKADHKEYISKSAFLRFYDSYAEFFNFYIGYLMDLKQKFYVVSKSYNRYDFSIYSSTDACDTDYLRSLDKQSGGSGKEKHGVIFTDISKLALKYFGQINFRVWNSEGKEELHSYLPLITAIFDRYISECKKMGIFYDLLDASERIYGHILDFDHSWRGYQKILDEYCNDYGINSENPYGLFIIGGDDVIPMPTVHNPMSFPQDEAIGISAAECTLDADILYSFASEKISLNKNNDVCMKFIAELPRFYVGRLPLENGAIVDSIYSDLYEFDDNGNSIGGYFHRAVEAYRPGLKTDGKTFKPTGMEINSPLAVAGFRMKETMCSIIEGIPMRKLGNIPGVSEDNVFLSPGIDLGDRNENTETYIDTVRDSDMLVFVLHGSNKASSSGFYGDPGGLCAFDPELFPMSRNKVFAGICCWGARFIGYGRDCSALMKAIFSNTLIYIGSSRSSAGGFWRCKRCEFSEAMLKYSSNYLLQGYDAGEALYKSKIGYIEKYLLYDNPYVAFATIMEFNLFGDPLLNVCPMLPKTDDFDTTVLEDANETCIPEDGYLVRKFDLVYSSQPHKSSMLSEVRGMVDDNFKSIHTAISESLYRAYGIEPRSLYCAYRMTEPSGEQGYSLKYKMSEGYVEHNTIVETDLSGNIKYVISMY